MRALGVARRQAVGLILGVAGVGSALLVSCVTRQDALVLPPDIPGATFIGDRKCRVCHLRYVQNQPLTVHARLAVPGVKVEGESGCEACHGPGSLHAKAPAGGVGLTIINPGRSPAACYRCHYEKEAEFSLPYRHPLEGGQVSCGSCHDSHGTDLRRGRLLAMARENDTCRECHREQVMPRAFEHEALREGCTACHAVHGSINPKLLLQNDSNLCLRCHAQRQSAGGVWIGTSNHTGRLAVSGGCWTAGCHTAPHGSNLNSHLRY
jgi:predicted CXXCH cytochrome family protein